MATSHLPTVDENILKALNPEILKKIRVSGVQMEKEIKEKLERLAFLEVEGYSTDGFVIAKVNGSHQVVNISFSPSFSDWTQNPLHTCELITEAINDGLYKIDLAFETEISTIKYKHTSAIISETTKKN